MRYFLLVSLIDTPLAAENARVALGEHQVLPRPGLPTLAIYRGSNVGLRGAVWFLGDCACTHCSSRPDDALAVIITPAGIPITHVRWASIDFPHPCETCGSRETKLGETITAHPLGSFSLAGVQMKVSATSAPTVVCAVCAA